MGDSGRHNVNHEGDSIVSSRARACLSNIAQHLPGRASKVRWTCQPAQRASFQPRA